MKKKSQNNEQDKLVIIYYDSQLNGWAIKGRRKPIFTAQTDLENYCRDKLKRIPITAPSEGPRQPGTYYPDLPTSSVWTGAPWDKTFSK